MNKALENMVHKLLFTCEQATLLIEKKAASEPIGFIDNLRLKGHLSICKWCRAYNKKVRIIDSAFTRITNSSSDSIEESEMTDFQNQLIKKTLAND